MTYAVPPSAATSGGVVASSRPVTGSTHRHEPLPLTSTMPSSTTAGSAARPSLVVTFSRAQIDARRTAGERERVDPGPAVEHAHDLRRGPGKRPRGGDRDAGPRVQALDAHTGSRPGHRHHQRPAAGIRRDAVCQADPRPRERSTPRDPSGAQRNPNQRVPVDDPQPAGGVREGTILTAPGARQEREAPDGERVGVEAPQPGVLTVGGAEPQRPGREQQTLRRGDGLQRAAAAKRRRRWRQELLCDHLPRARIDSDQMRWRRDRRRIRGVRRDPVQRAASRVGERDEPPVDDGRGTRWPLGRPTAPDERHRDHDDGHRHRRRRGDRERTATETEPIPRRTRRRPAGAWRWTAHARAVGRTLTSPPLRGEIAQPGQAAADAFANDRLRDAAGPLRDLLVALLLEHTRARTAARSSADSVSSSASAPGTRLDPSEFIVVEHERTIPAPAPCLVLNATTPPAVGQLVLRDPNSHAVAAPHRAGSAGTRASRSRTPRRSDRRPARRRACGAGRREHRALVAPVELGERRAVAVSGGQQLIVARQPPW